MVVATDEIRTYCMFNYANINWTSSAQAGSITGGRGGKQSAIVNFCFFKSFIFCIKSHKYFGRL